MSDACADDASAALTEPDPVAYDEPARTYVSLWWSGLILAAGFGVDVLIGGGIPHLPGWLLATALIVGIHALIIYGVRSTHSLSVTADEVRVGDEAIERSNVVGAEPGIEADLAVLGWPNGMPRGAQGVTVRMKDEVDVVVPTRDPARLTRTLGESESRVRMAAEVRPATDDDLPLLADIDDSAEAIFRVAGYDLPEIAFDEDGLADAKAIFVFDDPPIGFAIVIEVDSLAHLEEIAVVPRAMRHGVGTRLLERACEWAAEQGYPAITLTTYAEVPWNGPYYARHGFVEADEVTPELAGIRVREQNLGLDAVGPRIVMRRELGR